MDNLVLGYLALALEDRKRVLAMIQDAELALQQKAAPLPRSDADRFGELGVTLADVAERLNG